MAEPAAAAVTELPESDDAALAAAPAADDVLDSKEAFLRHYFLQEWEILRSLLAGAVSAAAAGSAADPEDIRKIRSIMDKYQEEGQLLEPYLESIVSPLMSTVRLQAKQLGAGANELHNIIKPLCIVIYAAVTVCGYKSVVKFFPPQVSDLELAVALLESCHGMSSTTALRQESTGEMETKCVLLLWLYILVLIPFDISTVDSSIGSNHAGGLDSEVVPLVMKIVDICKDYLSSSGPMRRISGMLLARLLTRPDMSNSLSGFMRWTHEALSSISDNFADQFKSIGILEALASIFKIGSPKALNDAVSSTWESCSAVVNSAVAGRNPLLRKFLVKLAQRIALICLPSPSRRYLAKNRSLDHNLSSTAVLELSASDQQPNKISLAENVDLVEEQMDVPEIVEEIIDFLLTSLRDSDTIVRWSAAKGIGRITACLTSLLSEEVLSSILQLFSAGEGDGSWHGGCLALAELARRGLLLPVSFPKVVPVIVKALHYDVRRGPHSIGSHVRDASAYVCWAFGRAYSSSDMRVVLGQLSPHLLTVACYDREVNCRRAASAAFQENVGRQGAFPHGIDIVTVADYFSLASRSNSYLNVAISIAQYNEYLYHFAEELLNKKITHWEKSLRELAARALSALVQYDAEYFAGYVLDKLIPCTLSSDLCTRHGATLAAGEITVSLHKLGFTFSTEKQSALAGVVPSIEKARLYRGKGGEIMRSAVSRFIACISLAKIFLNEKTKRSLLDTLQENVKHPNSQIQCAAVEALRHFVPAYLDDKLSNGIISKYLELLNDTNVAARRGAALALGVLPYHFLFTNWNLVVTKLCGSCTIEDNPDDPDAEARVSAIRGLVSVCETLTVAIDVNSHDASSLYIHIRDFVFETLCKALDDYAVDNRGDVGSWVREAAIDALERCTIILLKRDAIICRKAVSTDESPEATESDEITSNPAHALFDAGVAQRLVSGLAKQAVEKMDKIREAAMRTLQRILYNYKECTQCIPHREVLEHIIRENAEADWTVATLSYPRMVKLLGIDCYGRTVLSGLVTSTGGLQESLQKISLAALLDYVQATDNDSDAERIKRELTLSNDFLWILRQYKKCDRVITPTLKTLEVLLSKKIFLFMELRTEEFCSRLLDSLAIELKASKDFAKICAGLSILGYISSHSNKVNARAFSELLSFLAHKYPKIRRAAADQAYLVLLQNSDLIPEENMESALTVISDMSWEGDIEEARQQKQQLAVLARFASAERHDSSVHTPEHHTVATSAAAAAAASATDENSSYSSLVDFRGF